MTKGSHPSAETESVNARHQLIDDLGFLVAAYFRQQTESDGPIKNRKPNDPPNEKPVPVDSQFETDEE